MKKIIYLLMVFILAVPGAVMAENAENTEITAFERAESFLEGLNLIQEKKEPSEKITRAEFASYILAACGIKKLEPGATEDKFFGYTNDEEEREWEWIDNAAEETYPQATPFYDVTTEHKYWNDINEAAKLGIMSGDGDRRFRPDEYISENEALKVIVCRLGAEFMANGKYPLGYTSAAQNLQLYKGIKSEPILTYKNLAIYLYNMLHADTYEQHEFDGQNIKYRKTGNMYMYDVLEVESEEGVVNANGITRIGGGSGCGLNRIEIDGVKYTGGSDSLIGMNVKVYYREDDDIRTIEYIYPYKNDVIKIDADDITGYSGNYLLYEENEKSKKIYIGVNTNIIYNGKALTNYTDSMLTPNEGTVTFTDADMDGKYETVCIDDIKTILVGSVDSVNQKIYNKLKYMDVYDIEGKKLEITSADGTEMKIGDIGENAVLNIKSTTALQGEKNVEITVSNKIVKGKITGTTEDYAIIDGKEYYFSPAADKSMFSTACNGNFYLDASDKIVWYKSDSKLTYGYLMTAASKGGMEDDWELKIYTTDDEFKVLPLNEKITLNGVRMTAENAMKNTVMNDGVGIVAQLIKYDVDALGKVTEILTANTQKDKFAALYDGEEIECVFRNNGNYKLFNATTPMCYADDETVIINVPLTNKLDEDSYFKIAQEHDKYYKICQIYADSSDSAIGKVIIKMSDVVATLTPEGKGGLVKDITPKYLNDEEVYEVTLLGESGEVSCVLNSDKLMNEAKKIKKGDIVRFSKDGKGNISYIGKVFDRENAAIDAEALQNGAYSTKNPLATGNSYISNFNLLHGKIMGFKDNGEYIVVAPLEYTKNAEGGYDVGSAVSDAEYMIKRNICKIYTYDTQQNKLMMSNQDMISADVAGQDEASNVAICSFWGTAYLIVIYK